VEIWLGGGGSPAVVTYIRYDHSERLLLALHNFNETVQTTDYPLPADIRGEIVDLLTG
jgi:hypothetical protein